MLRLYTLPTWSILDRLCLPFNLDCDIDSPFLPSPRCEGGMYLPDPPVAIGGAAAASGFGVTG